jgi:signal transduction histidine kinase
MQVLDPMSEGLAKTDKPDFFRSADRLFRTTAFRLTAVYLALFIGFATLVLGYTAWHARRLIEAQITEQIAAEVAVLGEQYRQGGERRLMQVLERRTRRIGTSLYLLVDQKGDSVTGNVLLRAPTLEQSPGWMEAPFNWPDENEEKARDGKFRVFELPSGLRLFVGRDLSERDRLADVFGRARRFSILMALLIGAVSAFFVTRRVLSRVDGIAAASQRIMAGNLSERLPSAGSGDEFDRLAAHLNAMLDRMNVLMAGLRELSDNVAHDLRTPLTRLRNAAEDSLRNATSQEESRAGLERAIEESDKLIRVFDALLMIARAETGNLQASLEPVALDTLLPDLSDLYGPAAEEAGMPLGVSLEPGLSVRASRELLSRALANLIENALKYAQPEGAGTIVLAARRAGELIEISVADRGPGIPVEAREKVLERFVRLDKSRNAPGFGLGLSLVNAVARLMGGSLRLEDNAPGLRVVLSLPGMAASTLMHPIASEADRRETPPHHDQN